MSTRSHRTPLGAVSQPELDRDFVPIAVLDIELTERLPGLDASKTQNRAWIVARLCGEPVGTVTIDVDEAGLTPETLAARLWQEIGGAVSIRFTEVGLQPPGGIPASGLSYSLGHRSSSQPSIRSFPGSELISVVVCTRDRPQQLENCIAGLSRQRYPHFEVIVVDNAPTGDLVRKIVTELGPGPQYRYLVEPRPGLSWARNTGVAVARGEIIAFLDDDDEADPYWLTAIARGFGRDERVGCVTGSVLPARLDTPAQDLFEQIGGHLKGRGFRPLRFLPSGPQSPLFPLPPFGVGANMAFRRSALAAIRGFDVAMGAGTPTAACEDTLAMTLVLLEGYEIAYEPSAVMWHHHRRDTDGLEQQLHGYSVGLTAFYTALLRHRPRSALALLGLVPSFAGYLRSASWARSAAGASPHVRRRHFTGLLVGPGAYIRSTLIQRRLTASDPSHNKKALKL
jgi:O-antigen biosynthesis protein